MNEERKRRLDPPFCSFLHLSHPSFLSLPLSSNVCSVHWQSVCESVAIIYTHTVTLYYAHVAISSLILSVCVIDRFRHRHWNYWYWLCGDKEKFYLKSYRHWSYLRSGFFFLLIKEMDCIAFIPTDHISWHVVHI